MGKVVLLVCLHAYTCTLVWVIEAIRGIYTYVAVLSLGDHTLTYILIGRMHMHMHMQSAFKLVFKNICTNVQHPILVNQLPLDPTAGEEKMFVQN